MNKRVMDGWRCPVAKAQTGMPTVCNHYIQAIKCFIAPSESKHNGFSRLKTEPTKSVNILPIATINYAQLLEIFLDVSDTKVFNDCPLTRDPADVDATWLGVVRK